MQLKELVDKKCSDKDMREAKKKMMTEVNQRLQEVCLYCL